VHEAHDAGCGFGGTLRAMMVVPAGHDAFELHTPKVRRDACQQLVLTTGTEKTVPVIGAIDGAVVGGCQEALIAEFWCGQRGASIWGEPLVFCVIWRCVCMLEGVGRSLSSLKFWDEVSAMGRGFGGWGFIHGIEDVRCCSLVLLQLADAIFKFSK
jgi:hypothetical protein